ncbi:acetyltransferase [Penicillium odoratum]|uniref:acetyltransferase n=1 Tax=Penicillium odoratum TaxID=1167516 RepID=UPI002546D84E|nr:acetyltransferase [Penicillium odoratum]KAJ5778785.1 acetyltransferase [Penicillium odoratum]
MEISLSLVTTHDIPDLVRVHTAAFETDQFSNFMLYGREENAHQNVMQKSIEIWLSDPTSKLVKAVAGDGTIVGWACWLTKDKDDQDRSKALLKSRSLDTPNNGESSPMNQPARPRRPAQILSCLMRGDSMRWEENSMKGRKYLVLQALATSPSFQCRGIGSQLIQWGIDIADAEKLPCWVHASPAGHNLYKKAGFQEIGSSEYDLESISSEGRWGRYTFRYMQRSALDNR